MDNKSIKLSDLKNVKGIGPKTIERILSELQIIEDLQKHKDEIASLTPPDKLMVELDDIYHGDSVELMRKYIPSNTIDLTVTSPPYDNLRDYDGYQFDYKSMLSELYRVTKEGGVVVWVVGDATIDGSETGTSFKQALYAKDIGFKLHDTMIWTKDGGGAIGSNKSYTQNFEYMFIYTKGTIKTFNLIYDKPNKSFGEDKSGVGRRTKDGKHKIENRKPAKEFSRRNNYWYIPPQKGEHPAVFPEKLAEDHILSWSNEGDIVFDPMSGGGTTCKMAKLNNRKFLGFDISEKYVEISKERLGIK